MTGRVIRSRLRRRAVVTLHGGAAFSGVLFAADRTALVLRDARALTEAEQPVGVDGELLVRWDQVAYVQLP